MGVKVYEDAVKRVLERIDGTIQQVGEGREGFPIFADPETGKWVLHPGAGGYWCGLLLLAGLISGEDKYKQMAKGTAQSLERDLSLNALFKGTLSYYGWYLGYLFFKDEELRALAHKGAHSVAEMYNAAAGILSSGPDYMESGGHSLGWTETQIDTLPMIPILFWASKDLDRKDYYHMGVSHVKKLIEWCMRDDGAILQSACFDPGTGALIRAFTHKGISDESIWARAMAWGILGFPIVYHFTKDRFFLDAAVRASDWFLDHLPEDHIPFYDFDDPDIPNAEKDTSAAAMAASGMIKMARLGAGRKYLEAGEGIVTALATRYLTPVSPEDKRPTGILTNSCYFKRGGEIHGANCELVWGTLHFLEALILLTSDLKELF